jgi:glutathione S-transferase
VASEALLYDLSDSPFCLKARICLRLKEVPFRRVTLTLGRRRELRRLNPLGKVPVLVLGDDVIADSSAIVRHLEARYPEPGLIPDDPAARAYCYLVEEWADEALAPLVGAFKWLNPENRAAALANTASELAGRWPRAAVGWFVARRVRRQFAALGYTAAGLSGLTDRMRENLGVLSRLLGERSFLLGRTLTLADVAAFAQVAWMHRYAEARLLEEAPVVAGWLERVAALPAVADALPS